MQLGRETVIEKFLLVLDVVKYQAPDSEGKDYTNTLLH